VEVGGFDDSEGEGESEFEFKCRLQNKREEMML